MKKLLFLVAVAAGAGILVKRLMPGCGIDWEKRFAAMPDNAPPKWMFSNIGAIRANTDRILELLENAPPEAAGVPTEGIPTGA